MQYVPMPNMMMIASGEDSNNYLDIRNETHRQDQGTRPRSTTTSQTMTPLMARYSLGAENGFSPSNGSTSTTENLPGFGANFDNLSQQAVISWNHIFSSNKLNTVSLAMSRLSMNHTSQNDGVNDIVGQLGIQGIGFGGRGAWGAPWFAAQGYTGIGDTFAATPMHAWDTTIELRDMFAWQRGHHAIRFGGDARRYIWPMWGFFQNRGFYQFTNGYTTESGFNDGSGYGFASLLLSLPTVKQRQAGVPQMNLRNWGYDGFAEDSWQMTPTTTLNIGLRYEYTSPLYDLDNTNSNLIFNNGVPSVFIGGQNGYPKGLMYSNKHNFAPRFGIAKNLPRLGHCAARSLRNLLHAGGSEHVVQPAAQRAVRVPGDATGRQLHSASCALHEPAEFRNSRAWHRNSDATTVSFTAFDPHAPAEYVQQWNGADREKLWREHDRRCRLPRGARLPFAARAPDQQRASGAGAARAAASLQDSQLCSRNNADAQQHRRRHPEPDVSGEHHQSSRRHGAELVRRRLR